MKTVQWCSRDIFQSSHYYALCVDEDDYINEMHRLGKKYPPPFTTNGTARGTTHFFDDKEGKPIALVCIHKDVIANNTGIEIAGLLCHEAVHIWQYIVDHIGEFNESKEFEAYCIQAIFSELMWAYEDMVVKKTNKQKRKIKN